MDLANTHWFSAFAAHLENTKGVSWVYVDGRLTRDEDICALS